MKLSPAHPPFRRATALTALRAVIATGALALAPGLLAHAADGDPSKAGAYCKLPAPGEKPVCLAPAQAEYEEFFSDLDAGTPSAASAARIESDLNGDDDSAYLALSSLSYGYWQLAQRAAQNEHVDPALAEQLADWNELLSQAYADQENDDSFRAAVREAALDLDARTPVDGFECLDDEGAVTSCRPAAALVARMEGLDEQLGVRGAIRRVLERLFPEDS